MAVPGEVLGMWQAHQNHGHLPWKRLFRESIEIAQAGVTINDYISGLLVRFRHELTPSML